MPKVPGIETYVPSSRVIDGPRFAPSPVGRAIQGAGQDFEELGRYLAQRDDEEGRIWAAKKQSELRLAGLTSLEEKRNSGADLNGLVDQTGKDVQAQFDAAMKDAPSAAASRYLSIGRADLEGDLKLRALGYESEYRVTKRVASAGDYVDQQANTLATNPGMFAKVYAETKRTLDAITGLPVDARERLNAKLTDLGASAVAGMIERDPYGAAKQLQSGQWDEYLDPNARISLLNGAQSAIKSREAEARAAAAEARAVAAENANAYMADFGDYAAYRAAGNTPDPKLEAKYSPAAIARLGVKGAEGWAKKAADVQAQGDLMLALRSADTPEERAKIVAKAMETTKSPDNYQFNAGMAETIVATAGKFDAELEKAPGEVAARSGRVKDGFKESGLAGVAAMLGEQERLGVPEPRRVPLPESVATSLTERVASLPPEKQAEEVQAIAGEFGPMWPMVFRQIGAKLPADAATLATMPKGRPATLLAEAAALKDGELTAGLPSTAKRDVEDALADDDTMRSLHSSLILERDGTGTYASAFAATVKLALQYMHKDNLDAPEAASRAALEVTANSGFAEFNDMAVRVPANLDTGAIEDGMSAIANGFDPAGYDMPESLAGIPEDAAREQWANAVRAGRDVRWIGAPDESGLYLWDGHALVTKNGAPVVFTWDDLKNGVQPDVGAGNIDLSARPVVKNADGSVSTVRSISFNEDGQEILIPMVSNDGRIMSDQEAIDTYHRTGKYLGKFGSVAEANAYAEKLHNDQAARYAK